LRRSRSRLFGVEGARKLMLLWPVKVIGSPFNTFAEAERPSGINISTR
jgi:hypothetical protein